MTVLEKLTPDVRRLFDSVDVETQEPRLRRLLDYWRSRRGGQTNPAPLDIDPAALGEAFESMFVFERLKPAGKDWQLLFAGSEALTWMRPIGTWRRLSHLSNRRAAVRLRLLLDLVLAAREPCIARFHVAHDKRVDDFEVAVMPLASDHSHPDAAVGMIAAPPGRRVSVSTAFIAPG
jgi:hypothetical protein